MTSLSRDEMIAVLNPYITAATQWFERTLDDSANKRLSVPEAFLAVDAILNLYINVSDGLVVYEGAITAHLMNELPFMMTENIMMDAVKAGGNRQELHEKIRALSQEIKSSGGRNDLLEKIAADPAFGKTLDQLNEICRPEKYVGRAPRQTEDFLRETVAPALAPYESLETEKAEINV